MSVYLFDTYTKKQLCARLKMVGDTRYRTAWTKSRLVTQLASYDISTVLKTFSPTDLLDGLKRLNLDLSGEKKQQRTRLTVALTPTIIPEESLQNIRKLLESKDIDFVKQGLALVENLAPNLSSLQHLLKFSAKASSFVDIHDSFAELKHGVYITTWIIEKMEKWSVKWTLNRERRYRIRMSGYSFEYIMVKISKEAYDFWDNEKDIDLVAYIHRNLSEEERSSIPEAARFSNEEWYQLTGTIEQESDVLFDEMPYIKIEEVSKGGRHKGKYRSPITIQPLFSGLLSELKTMHPNAYSEPSYAYKDQPCEHGRHYVYMRGYEKGDTMIANFSTKGTFSLAGLSFDIRVDPFVGLTIARWHGVQYQRTPNSNPMPIEGEIESTWTYQWEAFVTRDRRFIQETTSQ